MDQNTATANNLEDSKQKPYIVKRYKPKQSSASDDPIPDYMNLLAMIFSMCGLMMKIKWCAWSAMFCSLISFANSRSAEDGRQVLSSFMLSVSAVVMTYLQNPAPMTPPW